MEAKSSNSCINLLLINLCFCFYHVLRLFLGKCNFIFFSDLAALISSIILRFYFSLFKTLFAIFDKFTILFAFLNHLLLIFKMYIYNARTTGYLNISHLLIYIKGIKDTEKKLCESNAKRRKKFYKKWKNILIN